MIHILPSPRLVCLHHLHGLRKWPKPGNKSSSSHLNLGQVHRNKTSRNTVLPHCERTTWKDCHCVRNKLLFPRLSVCLLCPWFTGQNWWSAAYFHVVTFIRCFALTVHGWMWVWRGRGTGLIHLRTGIYLRKLRTNGYGRFYTNFILCVGAAFSWFTTQNAITNSCAPSWLMCWNTGVTGWRHRK